MDSLLSWFLLGENNSADATTHHKRVPEWRCIRECDWLQVKLEFPTNYQSETCCFAHCGSDSCTCVLELEGKGERP